MRASVFPTLTATLVAALLAVPARAQIVVVPLEPAPGSEFDDGTGTGTGLVPTDPVTGFEPLPDDPGAGWEPIQLDPIDPDAVQPWGDVLDDGALVWEPLPPGSAVGQDVTTVEEDVVVEGTGAIIKGLDKLAGTVEEMTLAEGETVALGWLEITLGHCRYPEDNPSGDAYAWLEIIEEGKPDPAFRGWMIASSPGLNALDHPRFDVWVLNCTMPEAAETAEADDAAAAAAAE